MAVYEEKRFDLIVERSAQITNPLELKNLYWDGESPPDIVIMPGGTMLVKVGRYASPGERWCYRIATVANMVGGKLETIE